MRDRISAIGARFGILGLVLLSLALVSCTGTTQSPSEGGSAQVEPGAASAASTQAAATTTGTPVMARMVRSIAGIRLGEAHGSDVVKMYGPGFATPYPGSAPGRYYTDPTHSVTLHVETHTDDMVVIVELSDGVALPAGIRVDDDPALIASSLSVPAAIDQGIALGMTATKVIGRLGLPQSDETEGVVREVIYEAGSGPAEAYYSYSAVYLFVRDRLRSVSIVWGL